MKKSVIVFGILFSVLFNTANANTNPEPNPLKKYEVSKTTSQNVAPISIAIAYNDNETVEKLVSLGADIEVRSKKMGMTPLMYAARYNNVKLVKLLIDNGANTEAKSKLGITALKYAELANAKEVVKYLKNI